MIITIAHLRKAGYCARGTRAWFLKNNIDWREFMRYGGVESNNLPSSDLFVQRILSIARQDDSSTEK